MKIARKVKTNYYKIAISVFWGLAFIFIAASCSTDKPTQTNLKPLVFKNNQYSIADLEYTDRWYSWMQPISLVPDFPHDIHGVKLFYYQGRYYYHPWQISFQALWYLEGYRQTNDTAYIHLVNNYVERLLLMANRTHNALYFPYEMDYSLHAGHVNEVMMAPWYSGFTQGTALSLFSRIYEVTGNEFYRLKADSIYYSFQTSEMGSGIWTVMVDDSNYFWIEEYPFIPQTHVLNGYLAAIFGLHDYYMVTHDNECKRLIQGSCTTIARYFSDFRVPGQPVMYCLLHHIQDSGYHQLVIDELRQLSRIAADSVFSNFADSLAADYIP